MNFEIRNTHVLSVGFNHERNENGQVYNYPFGDRATEVAEYLQQTFAVRSSQVIRDRGGMHKEVLRALDRTANKMTEEDALFLYLALHGNKKNVEVSESYKKNQPIKTRVLQKQTIIKHLSRVPGIKVLMLDTCSADIFEVPENILLIAASKIDQNSHDHWFAVKVLAEIMRVKGSQDPFTAFVTNTLNYMHNYPLYPTEMGMWDKQYNRERTTGKGNPNILQRIAVRSGLILGDMNVVVNPVSYFPT